MSESNQLPRRRFIGNTVKLAVLGTVLGPLQQSCNDKKTPGQGKDNTGLNKDKKTSRPKKKRQKWSRESLVMNSKTKVVHLPSSKCYAYYDEIKAKNLQVLSLTTWVIQMESPVRFNRQQSGNIIEMLTLHELGGNISDTSMIIAIDSLSAAFGEEYERENTKNFRLHELMLQLITLNNGIPADQKWITFNAKVKKPPQLRKRQSWMADETAFNQRVKYITDRRAEYESRLLVRARKYSFT